MKKLTSTEFGYVCVLAQKYENQHKQRAGQSLYNALHDLYPEIALSLNGTENDPFYNDKNIEGFFNTILQPTDF